MAERNDINNTEAEDLIDVSEFESELSDEALTEIADEEVTPIKEITRAKAPEHRKIPSLLRKESAKKGTFVATLRERFSAFIIDSLVLFYFYWVYSFAYARIFLSSWNAPLPYSGWHGLSMHASFLFACFLYYFIFEGIFLATIGKFVCWMSVRKKDGQPASLTSTFLRNLFRPLDYILIIPVIFIMEFTKFTQRIGDIIGGSTVVKKFGTPHEPYNFSTEGLASASGRTIAATIDLALFGLFIAGYVLILSPDNALISLGLFLALPLVAITYFVLIEMTTETSPGKWITGYMICHEGGQRLMISGSIVRTIWRLFDTNPVGLLCTFLSANKQRPGDVAAGTVVIKSKRTLKGAISIIIAVILAVCTLYAGSLNKTNILSKKFRFNFLPRLSFIDELGFKVSEYSELTLDHFRFAANEPNNFRVPPTFSAGETVYLIFELVGYKKQDRQVWIQEDLSITYPDGTVGLRQTNIVDYKEVVKGTKPIELTNNIALPKIAKPGSYQVTISVRDKFANTEISETKSFFVRRPISELFKE